MPLKQQMAWLKNQASCKAVLLPDIKQSILHDKFACCAPMTASLTQGSTLNSLDQRKSSHMGRKAFGTKHCVISWASHPEASNRNRHCSYTVHPLASVCRQRAAPDASCTYDGVVYGALVYITAVTVRMDWFRVAHQNRVAHQRSDTLFHQPSDPAWQQ
jgi:hypothetical protein